MDFLVLLAIVFVLIGHYHLAKTKPEKIDDKKRSITRADLDQAEFTYLLYEYSYSKGLLKFLKKTFEDHNSIVIESEDALLELLNELEYRIAEAPPEKALSMRAALDAIENPEERTQDANKSL